jgi:peroxiredoxin (alkyl hydroperoxide reductase subunit C)
VTAFSDRHKEFADLDAEVLGVSTDTVFVHRAWIQTPRDKNGVGDLNFPLASDSTLQVARDYGVLVESEGLATRGLFIIDPNGILQYAVIHNLNVGRNVDETLRVLEALQTGGLCPANWRPGQKLLG